MKTRRFNSLMHFNNERWAAEVLGMQANPVKGPDLIDSSKIVEVKFTIDHLDNRSLSWRVLGYQKDYGKNREAYWGLATYQLSQPTSSIRESSLNALEELVIARNLYIVQWNWMNQFPVYFESGQTEKSKWAHYLIFPKKRLLPRVIKEIDAKKGRVLVTEGVDVDRFNLTQS